jgi:chemotaxis-related protein WspD
MTTSKDPASANQLLDRESDKEYLLEWTLLIQKEKLAEETTSENSVVIFRVEGEWLAISTLIFAEVAANRKIHYLPHRSNKVFLGIVNLKGELRLCISLANLLEIENLTEKKGDLYSEKNQRMMAIKEEDTRWVFPVDEIYGIFNCDISLLQNVPVTLTKSNFNYLKGVFVWQEKSVGYLDENLLFSNLQRSVL